MSLPTSPDPPRDKVDTTIIIVQTVVGVVAALTTLTTTYLELSPYLTIGILVGMVVLIAILAVIKSKHSVQKYKIYVDSLKELEKHKSWTESTRALTQNAAGAGMERNIKFTVYQSIISTFEKSAKDETKSELERNVYTEIVARLKDMQNAILEG